MGQTITVGRLMPGHLREAGEAALLIVVAQVWQAGETCRHRIIHCKAWQRTMDSVTGRNRHRYGGLWSLLHSER